MPKSKAPLKVVIIGSNCHIGDGASLEEAVLWRGINIEMGATLKQCIVGNDAEIEEKDQVINHMVP